MRKAFIICMTRLLPPPGGRLARAGALAITALVAGLSLSPNLSVPDSAPGHTDLVIHLCMQGALGFSLVHGWPRALPSVVLVLAGLVVGLELGQIWVPGRTFAMSDLLTNAVGACFGALLARWLHGARHRGDVYTGQP